MTLRARIARPLVIASAVLAVAAAAPAASEAQELVPGVNLGTVVPAAKPLRGESCANENLLPSRANLTAVRRAVLCLHNKERFRRGLQTLKENARLRKAALKHSQQMDRDNFFAHDTPSGLSMLDRIKNVSYLRSGSWGLGENLGWGSGRYSTAKSIMVAWMESPGHRQNVLDGNFREVGIGIVVGAPVAGSSGAIYTTDFGYRS